MKTEYLGNAIILNRHEVLAIKIILVEGVIGYGTLRQKISYLNHSNYTTLMKRLMSKTLIRKHKLSYSGTLHHAKERIFITLTMTGIREALKNYDGDIHD